ncbi:esterase-like activity of phytase family protein [Amaricoccus tamworthensis]|uniref:esterase-like activity of phytase family protein n=1 Tax=Amaricoccus tamworthensis TaxID=57002 RepID=UPI003C7A0C13
MRTTAFLAVAFCAMASLCAAGPKLIPDAEITWTDRDVRFGGLSGLILRNNGTEITAVSDRGNWVQGKITRENGRLTSVQTTRIEPILAISGDPLDDVNVDAEGLAEARDGALFVSFEAFHRIRRYPSISGPAQDVPSHPQFPRLQNNSGLEALAIDAGGTLHAIPERSGKLERPYPVYRYRGGKWDRSMKLRRDGQFLVVGADFGPDGRLYVLERHFTWLGGFATRVRRFDVSGNSLTNEATLFETGIGEMDNMEGITVWRDSDGRTRATLISDDNFFALQQTVLAEFIVSED